MPKKKEPRLCPDCNLKGYIDLVKRKSYTRTPVLDSNIKLCSRLRAYPTLPKCKHFGEFERIDIYFSSGKRKKKRKRKK